MRTNTQALAVLVLAALGCSSGGGSTVPTTPLPTPDPNFWPKTFLVVPYETRPIGPARASCPTNLDCSLAPHRGLGIGFFPKGPGTFRAAMQWRAGPPETTMAIYFLKTDAVNSTCILADQSTMDNCLILAKSEALATMPKDIEWSTSDPTVIVPPPGPPPPPPLLFWFANVGEATIDDYQGSLGFQPK